MRICLAIRGGLIAALSALTACGPQKEIQATTESVATINAVRETAAVSAEGDAADDPAIWVAPIPAESLVIATQKQGGLYVFDLSGATVQELPGGRPNNVDVRDDFRWPDGEAPIIGASDRSDNAIVLWRLDPVSRKVEAIPRARIATGFNEVYGFCLGRYGDDFIAVATEKEGEVGVWRLILGDDGAIDAERIVSFNLGSISEGCVVDDYFETFYVAQELNGIWRILLDEPDGASRAMIDEVGAGRLVADVEGLTIWRGANGAGYLIASVQGASRFAVYARDDSRYLGMFEIGGTSDGGADAVSGTDGIDVASASLGDDFPGGLFVAQDDENTAPDEAQNFKYVSWSDIATALSLETR